MVGQIDSLKLGISLGILWGLSVFFVTFIRFKKKLPLLFKGIQQFYFNCNPNTATGKIICTIAAFMDAFIGGVIVGYLYNHLQ